MNLTIDIGNSRVKIYLFTDGDHFEKWYYGPAGEANPGRIFHNYPEVHKGVLVNTGTIPDGWLSLLKKKLKRFIILGPDTPIPVENRYRSKETLGYDRVAAVVGAHYLFPDKNVLVVDAGTAITCDLVTSGGIYLGGTISPGIMMRFRALASFTSKLPEVHPEKTFSMLGDDTPSAIISGVEGGILAEVDGMIDRLKKDYTPLVTIITGGDADFFDKNLKNSIFVRPDLVATGLNRILEFNEAI